MLERVELAVQPRRQLDRVRAGLLLDADDDRRLAASGSLAPLQRAALADVGDVLDEHRPRATQGHHAVADFVRVAHAADGLEHVLLRTFRVDAGRGVLAGAPDGAEQLRQRHVVGAELVRVSNDLILTLGATNGCDLGDAGHGEQSATDHRVRHGTEGQRIVVLRRDGKKQDLAHD